MFAEASVAADGAFLKDLADFVRGKQVFFTIDLDGLDPSIMPAVGTPEPGGILWDRMLEICRVITREAAHVPVFDVVELAPIPGLIAPDFLSAKLVYKILSYTLVDPDDEACGSAPEQVARGAAARQRFERGQSCGRTKTLKKTTGA